jgi:hypothetical protein
VENTNNDLLVARQCHAVREKGRKLRKRRNLKKLKIKIAT